MTVSESNVWKLVRHETIPRNSQNQFSFKVIVRKHKKNWFIRKTVIFSIAINIEKLKN